MRKIRLLANYIVKTFFLIFFILLANLKVETNTTEIYSGANNRVINLNLMAMRLEEEQKNDIYRPLMTYSGDLTGYSADCPLCNGTLACKPSYYVKDGTDTYVDADYGQVRIVASSTSIACGTVVRLNNYTVNNEPVIAIVLDRGVLGTDLDLLTPNENYARTYVGRKYVSYDILREGWTRQ